MHGGTLRQTSGPVELHAFMPADGLNLKLLGPPQITLHGVPLSLRRRKAEALLVYLAVMGGPQSREALAPLLSGSATAELARKHLRTALSDLSDQIGGYLLVTRHTISLNRDLSLWLDVEQFTAMVDTTDPAALERAVAMYEDAFLTGFALRDAPRFEAWIVQEQQHIHTQLVQALRRLLDQAIERGEVMGAISFAQRLLAEEPWCDETHRQLIWLLARMGRRSEALDQYANCRRIITQDLSSEPEPETAALFERLRVSSTPRPHNLPAAASPVVGRERELATLLSRLENPTNRLITILGLGGSGKTCLALEAAHRVAETETVVERVFSDGVYLVDLAELRPRRHGQGASTLAANSLVKAIGRALDLHSTSSGDPAPQLMTYLRSKSMLLVLDNVEQLLGGAAILSMIMQQAPGVTLLVTSRARLGLPEEQIVMLGGLTLPTGPEDLEHADAGRLFLQRAQRLRMNKPLSTTDRAHVVRICQLVQGLPLALVLAANWLSVLSCAGIAAELAGGIDLLATTDSALPERQRSIRLILNGHWKELAVTERAALRQLAIFQGGFTVEAAQIVTGASSSMLHAIGERMLLVCDGPERYTLPELVHPYAVQRLAAEPDEDVHARVRHAAYYTELVQQHAQELGKNPRASEVIAEDIKNILAAWDWAIAHLEINVLERISAGLAEWYRQAGQLGAWTEQMERAAVRVRSAQVRDETSGLALQLLLANLLFCEAEAFIWQGQDGPARELLLEAHTIAHAVGALRMEAHCVYYQAWLLFRQGNSGASLLAEQALGMARVAQSRDVEASCLWLLGANAVELNDYVRALGYFERALPTFAAFEDRRANMCVGVQQAIIAFERGDFATAGSRFEDAIRLFRMQGNRVDEQIAMYHRSLLWDSVLGRHLEADEDLTKLLSGAQRSGDVYLETMTSAGQGQNALLQGDFKRAGSAFEHALRTSQETSGQAFKALALRGLGLVAHYHGDNRHARELGEQALRLANVTGRRRVARFAQRLVGHALMGLGAVTEAAVAYHQTLELDIVLGYSHLALEVTADLAGVAVAEGNLEQAAAYINPVVAQLQDHIPLGLEEPVRFHLTCYHVLKAINNPRAVSVLAAGFDLLQQRASQFKDDETRSRFVQSLPAHREVTRLVRGLDATTAKGSASAITA